MSRPLNLLFGAGPTDPHPTPCLHLPALLTWRHSSKFMLTWAAARRCGWWTTGSETGGWTASLLKPEPTLKRVSL